MEHDVAEENACAKDDVSGSITERNDSTNIVEDVMVDLFKGAQLSDKTIQILKEEEYTDLQSVRGITENDLMSLHIPGGQRSKLRLLVGELNQSKDGQNSLTPVVPAENPPSYHSLQQSTGNLATCLGSQESMETSGNGFQLSDGADKQFISQPGQPIVTAVTHQSVTIMWSPPVTGQEFILNYMINFKEEAEFKWQYVKTSSASTIYTVLNLEGGLNYIFKVKAIGPNFSSPESQCSEIATTVKPPSKPGQPRPTKVGHTSIHLIWDQPKTSHKLVQHYKVLYQREGTDGWIEQDTSDASCLCMLEKLGMDSEYLIKVQAVWEGGHGPFSMDSEDIRTLVGPSPPGEPGKICTDFNSITLEWERPITGSKYIEGYEVHYKKADDPDSEWKIKETTELGETIDGLEMGTEYIFTARGKWKHGFTAYSATSRNISTHSPKPDKPYPIDVGHDYIQLEWGEQHLVISDIRKVLIEYKTKSDNWKSVEVLPSENSNTAYLLKLAPATSYICRIQVIYETSASLQSETSETITTMSTSPPGKPHAEQTSIKYITITWSKPICVGHRICVQKYIVEMCTERTESSDTAWKFAAEVDGDQHEVQISGEDGEVNSFRVIADCGLRGRSQPSEASDEVQFHATEIDKLKDRLMNNHSILVEKEPLDIYQLQLHDVYIDENKHLFKQELGMDWGQSEKVIMVVGATGAGKSTLINGLVNNILGVQWKDNFRFKIVHEGNATGMESQARSQTLWITSYTLHHEDCFKFPYTLTIIDTPEFGETSGIARDQEIIRQIHEFFKAKGNAGVDHIDAIGFVVQASLPRLTPTQQYIFGNILSLFGKDIEHNIVLMITFADANTPPVLASIKEAKIPYVSYFKFNNSALFSRNQLEDATNETSATMEFNHMFWDMGILSFEGFLIQLSVLNPKCLNLTEEVLDERSNLEAHVVVIQKSIRSGLNKLEKLKLYVDVVKEHEADISKNKSFAYIVEEERTVMKNLEHGMYITNCLICNCTCHYPCKITDDDKKARCAAMERSPDPNCTVCQGKCHWKMHKNMQYRFEIRREAVTKTSEELQAKYKSAQGKRLTAIELVERLSEEIGAEEFQVLSLTDEVRKCLERLSHIALKPNPLTNVDYIQTLIQTVEHDRKPGWQAHREQLLKLKQNAECVQKAQNPNFDPFVEYRKILPTLQLQKETVIKGFMNFVSNKASSLKQKVWNNKPKQKH